MTKTFITIQIDDIIIMIGTTMIMIQIIMMTKDSLVIIQDPFMMTIDIIMTIETTITIMIKCQDLAMNSLRISSLNLQEKKQH